MARDYAKKHRKASKKALPGWIWMSGGLVIGLFVAFLVYINEHQTGSHPPTVNKVVKGFQKDIETANKIKQQRAHERAAKPQTETSPSFDFYTILPELEVAIPDLNLSSKPDIKQQTKKEKDRYILQAGSFRQHDVADRLKANLALLGIEADIQTVTINDKDTWHRVRVGPFTSLRKLDTARRRLQKNDIHTLVLKIKS